LTVVDLYNSWKLVPISPSRRMQMKYFLNNNVNGNFFYWSPNVCIQSSCGALGRMETRRQVMIPCLKEVKSIPIQVRFSSPKCVTISRNNNVDRNFFLLISQCLHPIITLVHWEGRRLGEKSWYFVRRKSKVFQFKFDLALSSVTPFLLQKKVYFDFFGDWFVWWITEVLGELFSHGTQPFASYHFYYFFKLLPSVSYSSHVVTLLVATGGSQGRQ
jgi:hypothetical protein